MVKLCYDGAVASRATATVAPTHLAAALDGTGHAARASLKQKERETPNL